MMPLDTACLKALSASKSILKLDLGGFDSYLEVR